MKIAVLGAGAWGSALAISLSAPNDEMRDKLMPINKKRDIKEVMTAAKEFEASLRRGERFTFEAGADKQRGGSGWADVWKRDFFAW